VLGWNYLYRAVDRDGKSVHSLLSESRAIESAQEFFRQAVKVKGSWPEKINLDGNVASHRGLRLLGKEDSRWQSVTVRARRYLNDIIEQDRSSKCQGGQSAHAAVTRSGRCLRPRNVLLNRRTASPASVSCRARLASACSTTSPSSLARS